MKTTTFVETRANHDKKRYLNSPKKITRVDDMIIQNLTKYVVQNRFCLWDIKITNFKQIILTAFWFEICYFHISQTKSSLDKIFYKIVYHHIIYMCNFFGEFRWFFCHGLHRFSRKMWFALDTFPWNIGPVWGIFYF